MIKITSFRGANGLFCLFVLIQMVQRLSYASHISLFTLISILNALCRFVFSPASVWLAALQLFVSDDVAAVAEDSDVASGSDAFATSACVVDVGSVCEVVG